MRLRKENAPKESHMNALSYNTDSLMRDALNKVMQKRDARIIARLEEKGYVFPNELELSDFLLKRCSIVKHEDTNEVVLLVDEVPLLTWYDTYRLEQDGDTFNIIAGEKP